MYGLAIAVVLILVIALYLGLEYPGTRRGEQYVITQCVQCSATPSHTVCRSCGPAAEHMAASFADAAASGTANVGLGADAANASGANMDPPTFVGQAVSSSLGKSTYAFNAWPPSWYYDAVAAGPTGSELT